MIVVKTNEEAEALLNELGYATGPFGIDTETEGIDPRSEPPGSGRGRIVCWSVAWHDDSGVYNRAYLPTAALEVFKNWLEDPGVEKVGHNIFGFDRHMFWNHGINLSGIVGDTMHMSKLAWNHPMARHGLKSLAQLVGVKEMAGFKDLFTRQTPGKLETVDKVKKTWRKVEGERVTTIIGGDYQYFYKTRELVPLSEIQTNPVYRHKLEALYEYASLDAEVTLRLYHKLSGKLRNIEWKGDKSLLDFYDEVWNPSLYVLGEAERNGFDLDPDVCDTAVRELRLESEQLENELAAWTGNPELNWNSPKQVQKLLYETMGFNVPPVCGSLKAVKRTKKGKYPTDEAALTYLAQHDTDARPLLKVLEYKKSLKTIQRLEKLPTFRDSSGRIHYQLSPSTDTGRLSAKNPPIQQIPKSETLRSAFVAGPGYKLVVADYSALEMRILAHFLAAKFDDWTLANDLASEDFHQATADRLSITRDMAKCVNYSVNYGKSAKGLAAQLDIHEDEADDILEAYYEAYPAITRWQIYCESYAQRNGFIRTLSGRYRHIPEIKEQYYRGSGYRKAINTPIQGSAADLVTAAMLKTNAAPIKELQEKGHFNETLHNLCARFVCQVHDELIFRVPEENADAAKAEVQRCMETAIPLLVPVPVEAHIGDNWWNAK